MLSVEQVVFVFFFLVFFFLEGGVGVSGVLSEAGVGFIVSLRGHVYNPWNNLLNLLSAFRSSVFPLLTFNRKAGRAVVTHSENLREYFDNEPCSCESGYPAAR